MMIIMMMMIIIIVIIIVIVIVIVNITCVITRFNSSSDVLTKRKVLSIASQLFEPLGLVLPVTVLAHLFLADLWDDRFGWDKPLPSSKTKPWMNIGKELPAASQFEFSPWIDFDSNQPVTLHVFTDASKSVIGSVAYLSQQGICVLLGSKSKLAPRGKKTLTIPQFELSAMLLGCELCASLLATVKKDCPAVNVRLWTDPEIALHLLVVTPVSTSSITTFTTSAFSSSLLF